MTYNSILNLWFSKWTLFLVKDWKGSDGHFRWSGHYQDKVRLYHYSSFVSFFSILTFSHVLPSSQWPGDLDVDHKLLVQNYQRVWNKYGSLCNKIELLQIWTMISLINWKNANFKCLPTLQKEIAKNFYIFCPFTGFGYFNKKNLLLWIHIKYDC